MDFGASYKKSIFIKKCNLGINRHFDHKIVSGTSKIVFLMVFLFSWTYFHSFSRVYDVYGVPGSPGEGYLNLFQLILTYFNLF